MNIIVTNRPTIQHPGVLQGMDNHIIISVTMPTTPLAGIHETDKTLGILRLTFNDIYPMNIPEWKVKELFGEPILFSQEMADSICDFVEKHKDNVSTIIVHCEAGHSRSPAIAAALCQYFDDVVESQFFDQSRYRLNMLVYSTLLNTILARMEVK